MEGHPEISQDFRCSDSSIALKDLDFLEDQVKIKLPQPEKNIFLNQMVADSMFLESHQINDYSLLIGIHLIPPRNHKPKRLPFDQLISRMVDEAHMNKVLAAEAKAENDGKRFYEKYKGGILAADASAIYVVGVIDILTHYESPPSPFNPRPEVESYFVLVRRKKWSIVLKAHSLAVASLVCLQNFMVNGSGNLCNPS